MQAVVSNGSEKSGSIDSLFQAISVVGRSFPNVLLLILS